MKDPNVAGSLVVGEVCTIVSFEVRKLVVVVAGAAIEASGKLELQISSGFNPCSGPISPGFWNVKVTSCVRQC